MRSGILIPRLRESSNIGRNVRRVTVAELNDTLLANDGDSNLSSMLVDIISRQDPHSEC